jgi:hypothetical protein
VYEVLPAEAVDGLTVKEIGDGVAADRCGQPLKAETIRVALSKGLRDRVDTDGARGVPGRWWRR